MLATHERQSFDLRFAEIRSIAPAAVLPQQERSKHKFSELGVGGVFRLGKFTYRVTALSLYRETDDAFQRFKQDSVTEFTCFCLETGETVYFEWSIDDRLEICMSTEELRFTADLKYADGGGIASLDDLDELVDEEAVLTAKGRRYRYEDDWSARVTLPNGKSYCVFIGEWEAPGDQYLTIESWSKMGAEDGEWEYEAWLSEAVHPTSIEILCLGEKASQ